VRIALVSREVHPFVGGGIAPIVAAAARRLTEIAEVTLVTAGSARARYEEMVAAGDPAIPPGVRFAFVEEPDDFGGWFSYMHAWSGRVDAALREAYPERGPDLIEFCDYLGEGFVTIQARHTRDPWLEDTLVAVRLHTTSEIVSVLDGHSPDDFATASIHEAERYCLRHADRLLWSGGDVLGTYERYYAGTGLAPGVLLPDAFLVEDEPSEGPGTVPGEDEPMRLLYLGRMERRKGVQNLIRAITAMPRADVELTLLGGDTKTGALGGSLRAQLELMAAEDPRIGFFEGVPRAEVSEWIKGAHAVVVPSLWECWPNTAREALMHNRPLLATPVGGLVGMVQPGRTGWLARDTSAAAIGDAIRELAADPEEVAELIRAGGPRERFHELTDVDDFLRGYEALVAERPVRAAARTRAKTPLVSVVVPYFKLEAHVVETVDSALAQTHPEIEVVIVNDGSLRNEDGPLYELEQRDRVRVVTQVNSGLGAARNLGVRSALGDFILPLDADDTLEPGMVERCLIALEGDPSLAYVATWTAYMDERGGPSEAGTGYQPYGNWSKLIERNNVGGTCSAVFRREVFDAGFAYSNELTSYEDWFLYREMHHAGRLGAVIPERLFNYRIRSDSMMREIGQPLLERLVGEMRAMMLERGMTWTAP
jgi:glycosyltransferase involved in cell wall biosynthesis